MKERTGFIFLKKFDESIKDLDFEDRCVMYESIINYALYFEEPSLTKGYLISIWKLIKNQIDDVQKKYDSSIENGKKGGRPKKPTNNLIKTQEEPKNNLTETCEEPLKVKEKLNIKENINANAAYENYMSTLDLNNQDDIQDIFSDFWNKRK